jgi:hypothetical protein
MLREASSGELPSEPDPVRAFCLSEAAPWAAAGPDDAVKTGATRKIGAVGSYKLITMSPKVPKR